MKKVVSVFFCIVVLFGLFAFSAGASAPILCPHCGSTAKLVGSREEGMYIVYKYRCTNSACGHTFESKFLAGGGSTRGGGAGRRDRDARMFVARRYGAGAGTLRCSDASARR